MKERTDTERLDWIERVPQENLEAVEWTWRQTDAKSVREAIDRNMEAEEA